MQLKQSGTLLCILRGHFIKEKRAHSVFIIVYLVTMFGDINGFSHGTLANKLRIRPVFVSSSDENHSAKRTCYDLNILHLIYEHLKLFFILTFEHRIVSKCSSGFSCVY